MRSSFAPEALAAFRALETVYDPDRLFARGHRAALRDRTAADRGSGHAH